MEFPGAPGGQRSKPVNSDSPPGDLWDGFGSVVARCGLENLSSALLTWPHTWTGSEGSVSAAQT